MLRQAARAQQEAQEEAASGGGMAPVSALRGRFYY
jgi:hypothetical protein